MIGAISEQLESLQLHLYISSFVFGSAIAIALLLFATQTTWRKIDLAWVVVGGGSAVAALVITTFTSDAGRVMRRADIFSALFDEFQQEVDDFQQRHCNLMERFTRNYETKTQKGALCDEVFLMGIHTFGPRENLRISDFYDDDFDTSRDSRLLFDPPAGSDAGKALDRILEQLGRDDSRLMPDVGVEIIRPPPPPLSYWMHEQLPENMHEFFGSPLFYYRLYRQENDGRSMNYFAGRVNPDVRKQAEDIASLEGDFIFVSDFLNIFRRFHLLDTRYAELFSAWQTATSNRQLLAFRIILISLFFFALPLRIGKSVFDIKESLQKSPR